MEWSVLATFAGVLVAAFGAAWAIVREQSVMRQLERVTAVLKDMPDGERGREELVVVRAHLARRLNEGYRAPRAWRMALTAWTLTLFGGFLLIMAFCYGFVGFNGLLPPVRDPRSYGPPDWLELALFYAIVGTVLSLIAAGVTTARRKQRRTWLESHHTDDADRWSV